MTITEVIARINELAAKAKAEGKKSWDDAHMSPSERTAKMQEERDARIKAANERTEAANARTEAAKARTEAAKKH